tara:strand:+ start:257 stop:547 length:291 start_codon:yes stop_codon:yes gene_type:complete
MAKSFVEVPQDAVRISVGEHTEVVAWQSEYNGEKQISLGKSTQYKKDGDVYTKMAPPITAQIFHQLVTLANGHLFTSTEDDGADEVAIEAPRRGAR